MPVKDAQTERLIIETAMRIFFVEGNIHAKTQTIADAAGVNRGLLYYYFKNREQLLQVVFKEALTVIDMRMRELFFRSNVSFKEKIGQFVEFFIDNNLKYPYLEMFLITEVNSGAHNLPKAPSEDLNFLFVNIEKGLKEEIKKGNVPEMSAHQFMANVISLCAYPVISKMLMKDMMMMDEHKYQNFIKERKQLVLKVLFRNE
jgi:AcrR family transcriptional regulator